MEPLVDHHRQLSGEYPERQDHREAMTRDRCVLLGITEDQSGATTQR